MKILASCILVLSLVAFPVIGEGFCFGNHDVEIILANGSDKEKEGKKQLERILEEHGDVINGWLYTRTIIIDENDPIPHSHPVMTVNCDYLDNDLKQLSVLLHEQIHWYLATKEQEVEMAIIDFKELYPKVPVGGQQGARNEYSTYLHLINCDLEFQAMTETVGLEKAKEILQDWNHYQWIYDKVLNDERIRDINKNHDLLLQLR